LLSAERYASARFGNAPLVRRERRRGGERSGADMTVTWQGRRDVRIEQVPDPKIEQPTDAVIRVTSTNLHR